jgi:hypothetical protein
MQKQSMANQLIPKILYRKEVGYYLFYADMIVYFGKDGIIGLILFTVNYIL